MHVVITEFYNLLLSSCFHSSIIILSVSHQSSQSIAVNLDSPEDNTDEQKTQITSEPEDNTDKQKTQSTSKPEDKTDDQKTQSTAEPEDKTDDQKTQSTSEPEDNTDKQKTQITSEQLQRKPTGNTYSRTQYNTHPVCVLHILVPRHIHRFLNSD